MRRIDIPRCKDCPWRVGDWCTDRRARLRNSYVWGNEDKPTECRALAVFIPETPDELAVLTRAERLARALRRIRDSQEDELSCYATFCLEEATAALKETTDD